MASAFVARVPRGASYQDHGPPMHFDAGRVVHHYEPREFSPARRQLFREEAKDRSQAGSPARDGSPSM